MALLRRLSRCRLPSYGLCLRSAHTASTRPQPHASASPPSLVVGIESTFDDSAVGVLRHGSPAADERIVNPS